MKLLSLHINNYGKLSNYDYKFDELTSFCEDNGFGKSTISSYIKAMFYGLESTKSNAAKFLDRKHFYPFKGGNFGGNITFIYNDNTYRIERTFDEKSETKDVLVVYKNDNPTNELGDVPGITIFGINKESFERLISINSDKITIETDSDINSKLNNYIENVGEDFDIDAVSKKLKDVKRKYTNNAKFLKEDIKNLEFEIKNLEEIKLALDSKYQELSELENEKNQAITKYNDAAASGALVEQWKHFDAINKEIDELNKNMMSISLRYPQGFPSEEEIVDIKSANNEIQAIEESLKNSPSDNKNNYDRLILKYKNHLPTEDDLKLIENNIGEYEKLKEDINLANSKEKSEKEIELEKHFYGEDINDDLIKKVDEEVKYLKNLELDLKNINPTNIKKEKRITKTDKKMNKTLFISLLAVSLLFIVLGIALGAILNKALYAISGVGVIILIVDILVKYLTENKEMTEFVEIEENNPEYQNKELEVKNQTNKVLNLFARFRYTDTNPDILLYRFNHDLNEYNKLKNDNKQKNVKLEEDKKKYTELKNNLDKFFRSVGYEGIPYKVAYNSINQDLATIGTLKIVLDNASTARNEKEKKVNDLKLQISKFYLKYNISYDYSIDNVKNDLNEYKNIAQRKKNKELDARVYKEENNLNNRPQDIEGNLEELNLDAKAKLEAYAKFKQEIENLESEVLPLDDKKDQYDELKKDKEKADHMSKVYDSLIEELGKADQVLKDKYVAPIRDSFTKYAKLLEATIGEKVHMDKNYKISFDRDGALRSYEHLSNGNLTICALCFRLALLDKMFDKEKPFIIMDDPFVSLDEKHFNKTKELIKELVKDKQIIYFCCHESRSIK